MARMEQRGPPLDLRNGTNWPTRRFICSHFIDYRPLFVISTPTPPLLHSINFIDEYNGREHLFHWPVQFQSSFGSVKENVLLLINDRVPLGFSEQFQSNFGAVSGR